MTLIVDVPPVNKKSNCFTRHQKLSAFLSLSSSFIINHVKLLMILMITLPMLSGVMYRTSYLRPVYAAMFHNSYSCTFISSRLLRKQKEHQSINQILVRNNICTVNNERQRPRRLVQQHTVSFLNLSQRDTNVDDSRSNTNSFMNRLPNESDDAYFRRIVTIASNPKSFENAVLNNDGMKQELNHNDVSNNITNINASNTTNTTGTKSKYVRAEEWDAEEKRKMKSGSWEERVQFDGQLYGNRVNQNEILRQHLKGF